MSPCNNAPQPYQRIRGVNFKINSQWWARKRIHYWCKGGVEKSVLRITVWHHEASLVMPEGDPQDGFFYPILTLKIDSYSIYKQKALKGDYIYNIESMNLEIVVSCIYLHLL